MSVSLTPSHALGFNRPLTTLVKRSLTITNHNAQPVAFKVKTTAPKLYCVRPNTGRVEPGQSVDVSVMLQPLKEEPPSNAKCKDKFLIQSTLITTEKEALALQDIWTSPDMSEEGKVQQQKLRVTYLPAEGQTLVEEDEEAHANMSSMAPNDSYDPARPSNNESAYATVRQHLPVNGDTVPESILARPSTPPGDFSVAQEEPHEEHPSFDAPGVIITPPEASVPAAEPKQTEPVPEPAPAPVIVPIPVPAPAPQVRAPSAPKPAPQPPLDDDYATKYAEAQAEVERLRGVLATSQPPTELRRRTRRLSDTTAVDVAVIEETPIHEGVPLQVVVIIALGVFITTYLFF